MSINSLCWCWCAEDVLEKWLCQATFSSPETTIILTCGRDRELWLDPIFWACAQYSFHILSQSDLPDLTKSPWITDFRCWTKPELLIPVLGAGDENGQATIWEKLDKRPRPPSNKRHPRIGAPPPPPRGSAYSKMYGKHSYDVWLKVLLWSNSYPWFF